MIPRQNAPNISDRCLRVTLPLKFKKIEESNMIKEASIPLFAWVLSITIVAIISATYLWFIKKCIAATNENANISLGDRLSEPQSSPVPLIKNRSATGG